MVNKRVLFNNGWEFAKNNSHFTPIDIPHDWLIYNTYDLYESGLGIYQKNFEITELPNRAYLIFEGVYMDCKVFINDQLIGEWKNGYSTFQVDITKGLKLGDNKLKVDVNHQSPNGRWYSGAGIYRNVWLQTSGNSYFKLDGTYVTMTPVPEKEYKEWDIRIDSEINVQGKGYISHTIIYDNQKIAVSLKSINSNTVLDSQILNVLNPALWSAKSPNLCSLISQLYIIENEKEVCVDSVTQNIGFKHILLDPKEGLIVNGKKIKLQGTCEHHDLGCLGSAVNRSAIERRLKILKTMGVNAIRTAHNMPAVELMDLADEMGFYIVSEAFDMWERPKVKYDYARFFKTWAERDVRSWIRRDRNHPSLIMWSIGNEIYDTHFDERGQEITKRLISYVIDNDPRKNGKITIGSNYMPWENAQKCGDIVKVVGYNYGEKYYNVHHNSNPDWIIYGSETCSVVQSRGIYHFPYQQSLLADDDEQCSSLGNSTTSWGARSTERCIISDRDTKYSLGQFIWTGFDYIGEPTPYHTKNSYFGQIDTAGFPKDSYYIFQAEWTSYKDLPIIHIFPYWDFNPGQTVDIRVCSNAPRIELFFNSKSQGDFNLDHVNGLDLLGHWSIQYEPGELKAVAYDEDGNIIAQEIKKSFKDPYKINLIANKNKIKADGQELVFIEIFMEDINGNPVENANNRVDVKVTGCGRLIGLDNGDSTDYDAYKGTNRRLFSGKLLAIIAPTLSAGIISMEVKSKGIKTASLKIESTLPENIEQLKKGLSVIDKNYEQVVREGSKDEVPIRKLQLTPISGQGFTQDSKEKFLDVKIFPENATYKDLEWRIVNDAGITSNIAKLEVKNNRVKLIAISDGKFQVRAMCKNGSKKIRLISQLDFTIEGLGETYKNPYNFISAGLYDDSKGEVTNGNERGIATSRDGETQICFRNIDFGEIGSEVITMPIFTLSDEVYNIAIWSGMPHKKDSFLIKVVTYQKPSKWNIYQEETYNLGQKFKGITSICFVLNKKIHLKGFCFKKTNRAFETLYANNSDYIYGDNFKMVGSRVEDIGNNVSLEFLNMDFGDSGITRIKLCGHSPIDRNTIHLRFIDQKGNEERRIVEFDHTEDYMKREFNFDKIEGLQKVIFVFLPGSNFNLEYFTFIE